MSQMYDLNEIIKSFVLFAIFDVSQRNHFRSLHPPIAQSPVGIFLTMDMMMMMRTTIILAIFCGALWMAKK